MFRKFFSLWWGFYDIVASALLFVIFKPLLAFIKKLNVNFYRKFSFALLSFTNYVFLHNMHELEKFNKIKYDIRTYRDALDRNNLGLLFKAINPETLLNNKVVLDFGCGAGGKDREMLKYNPKKVVGIDPSERNIKYALELAHTHDRLSFIKQDVFHLKGEEIFDTILIRTSYCQQSTR